MSQQVLIDFLSLTNETLTASIVIVAASLLLYNLFRNIYDRVTRVAAALLGCVTIVSTAESIAGLDLNSPYIEAWYRFQWLGIAFMPAVTFHLADALLSTTGRPSRGRRRRVIRLLYALSTLLAGLAFASDSLVRGLASTPVPHLLPGPLFALYVLYFVTASVTAAWLVWRARARCLTRTTRRRMTLLFAVFLTPGLGIFPYSTLFTTFESGAGVGLLPLTIVFNLANLGLVLTLLFLAYPLSFFGSNKPDRIIKAELLQFLLRGPFTASVLLVVMVSVPRLSRVAGVRGSDFVIVGVVAAVLFLQWAITLLLPRLETTFIFTADQASARRLRELSERLLTRADSNQLKEAVLAAICNQLRAPYAFIAAPENNGLSPQLGAGLMPASMTLSRLRQALVDETTSLLDQASQREGFFLWQSFWLFPLYSSTNGNGKHFLGLIGLYLEESPQDWTGEEQMQFEVLAGRVAKLLADWEAQRQIFLRLEEVAPSFELATQLGNITPYGQFQTPTLPPAPDQALPPEDYVEWVHQALRDFWGGPKLAQNQLLRLRVVQMEQGEDKTPAQALQNVLRQAIESLKPQGERSFITPDWTLYNILDLRFLQGKKVRDVAPQLAMSDADFYRKQKIAIEALAHRLKQIETEHTPPPTTD